MKQTQNEKESHHNVFLSHVRLYIFAETWLITKLKNLALGNFCETLKLFHLYPARTDDIVRLLEYVNDERHGGNEMRTLLMDYVGYEMDTLIDDEKFAEVVRKNERGLVKDFLKVVKRRICQ